MPSQQFCRIRATGNVREQEVYLEKSSPLPPMQVKAFNHALTAQVLFIKAMFSMKSKSFLTFSNCPSFPASYNYGNSCEQREEDERLARAVVWCRVNPLYSCGRRLRPSCKMWSACTKHSTAGFLSGPKMSSCSALQ